MGWGRNDMETSGTQVKKYRKTALQHPQHLQPVLGIQIHGRLAEAEAAAKQHGGVPHHRVAGHAAWHVADVARGGFANSQCLRQLWSLGFWGIKGIKSAR